MAYPDALALMKAYLDPLVTPPVCARVPDPRPDSFVTMRLVNTSRLTPVRVRPRIDFYAWAKTDSDAWTLGELVYRSVHALAGTTLLGPTCYAVEEFLGPRQADDTLTGTPRIWMTLAPVIRANDAIAP